MRRIWENIMKLRMKILRYLIWFKKTKIHDKIVKKTYVYTFEHH